MKGLIIGAGIGAIGLVLYKRLQAAKAKAPPAPGKCEQVAAIAESAQKGSGAAALAACKALGWLGDKLSTDWEGHDRENQSLNGEVEIPMTTALLTRVTSAKLGVGAGLRGSVVRFKNGCAPFEGAVGWEKCAPGTHNMQLAGGLRTRKLGEPHVEIPAELNEAFMHSIGDPFTQGPYTSDGTIKWQAPGNMFPPVTLKEKFDLPLAAGETGWLAGGRAFKCAEGTEPAWGVRDHREGALGIPACTVGGESTLQTTATPGPLDLGHGVRTDVACGPDHTAPAGMTWAVAADGTGYWRRLMLGEAPNPGPCGPPIELELVGVAAPLAVKNGRLADMQ